MSLKRAPGNPVQALNEGRYLLRTMHDAHLNMTLLPRIARRTDTRILFLVLDGLGGVTGDQPTALQASAIPNMDALAKESALGRHMPVGYGITPGSGPGHFSIFGYDPVEVDVGRGLLEALGLGVEVNPGDVCVRGNYCTVDADGNLTDRRAGRIATELAAPLSAALNDGIDSLEGASIEVHHGLQYRFAMVMRGEGLEGAVLDTDPQVTGVAPLEAKAVDAGSERTARVANAFVARAREILGDRDVANGVLLRGISGRPALPTLGDIAQLRPCAIAAYPAYRGVASLIGMDIIDGVGPTSTIADEVDALERVWDDGYDFFFLHVKGTDSAGEDGDEARKGEVIEAFDKELPRIRALNPDVIVITGDHSTPGPMAGHSWHPVPTLLWGPWVEPNGVAQFDETTCQTGRLGDALPAPAILRLLLASAGKLAKFGA